MGLSSFFNTTLTLSTSLTKNLLTNSSFDNGSSGWAPYGGWTLGNGTASIADVGGYFFQPIIIRAGNYVVEIELASLAGNSLRFVPEFPVGTFKLDVNMYAPGIYRYIFNVDFDRHGYIGLYNATHAVINYVRMNRVDIPASFYGSGSYLDDNDGTSFVYATDWLVYNDGSYLNNACHFLEIDAPGVAYVSKPVKGNALRYSTGSNSAPRGLVVDIREWSAVTEYPWVNLGTFTGPGDPQTLALPNPTLYYEVRLSAPYNGRYTVIDVLEVI